MQFVTVAEPKLMFAETCCATAAWVTTGGETRGSGHTFMAGGQSRVMTFSQIAERKCEAGAHEASYERETVFAAPEPPL